MPKERRKRTAGHDQSVRLPHRQFAVDDRVVEHVEVGTLPGVSAEYILKNNTDEHQNTLKKKEKQQMKRDAFMERLSSTQVPYSRNHARRLKRKTKEQIGGGLVEMEAAIAALDEGSVPAEIRQPMESQSASPSIPTIKPIPGQIGEGKGVPLNKSQRKRALELERLRFPLILSNPDFASDPFQTIRTHAQNTLLQRKTPS